MDLETIQEMPKQLKASSQKPLQVDKEASSDL